MAATVLAAQGCAREPAAEPVPKPADMASEEIGRVTVSGAWALYPMMVKWAGEYRKGHPDVAIDVSAGGAGKGMADALSGTVDLGMVSRDVNPAEVEKGAWWVSVVKDAVVPVVNSGNPVLEALLNRGLKREDLAGIWVTGKATNWSELAGTGANELPVHAYTRSDACGAAETWAKYLGGNPQDLKAIGVYGDPGLAEAVRRDPLGIGFNNINFAYDSRTRGPVGGLRVAPLDINGNGTVDPEESFYGTLEELTKAIADGRYPSPPARALHLVSRGVPASPAAVGFIRWILTEGQAHVAVAGYICLPPERLKEELGKLDGGRH